MPTVKALSDLPAAPGLGVRLWSDLSRWPTFIDGFGHVLEVSDDWPEVGSKVIWQSGPAGRGRVTERVLARESNRFTTEVFEDQLTGEQTLRFGDGAVEMQLDYELTKGGPLRGLTDVLFIRRALTMALDRTLVRFSREAADEATL
ncbi:MAG: hypothetical protein QOJ29_2227 [Thermoleophilaceae bacterium]|nr:hypothetical protein [Thermoleophilaceae bacterium]